MNSTLKLILATSLAMLSTAAFAQTKLEHELSYFDLGVQAAGQFTKTVSGPVVIPGIYDSGQTISESASNTVGALFTLRFTPRPYIGVEVNASYARYAETFPPQIEPVQIQTQANEFTAGYLVTPPYLLFGLKPYASAGAGTIRFAPTRAGGQGAPEEGRLAAYYNLGVQKSLLANLGVRVGFRQVYFLAPDFVQNYLTINKRTNTSEPVFGFYLKF